MLNFTSPWNLGGKTVEEWSQSFYCTGTIAHSDVDAEAAAHALSGPALAYATPKTSYIGFAYYPQGSVVSTVNKVYSAGTYAGTASYIATETLQEQQLEVCAVAHCPTKKNTRGKQIYLRKYFHDVKCNVGDPNTVGDLITPSTVFAPFNTGAGPHLVRPCSPTTGDAGASWTPEAHAYTHQLRKGKKRKKPGATLGSIVQELVNAGMDAASALALARRLIP